MIRASPLLLRQLERIKRANWSVHWNLGNGSSCNPMKSRIDVDVATNAQVVMQNLAHEASHAFDPFVQPAHYASEGAYLGACMRNEATAVISHLFVRSEIHANGGLDIGILYSDPHYYEAAAAFYGRHRNYERLLQHVMAMYVWQVNSIERVCYWQTFMNHYRAHWGLPPPMRVDPFLPAYRHQTFQRLRLEMLMA